MAHRRPCPTLHIDWLEPRRGLDTQPLKEKHHGSSSLFAGLPFVVFFVASSVGCSNSPSTPTSPSSGAGSLALTADQLAGTWDLSSIQPAGQVAQAAPADATYTLTFADTRLSTRADCNVCSGGFTLSEDTLTAGPALACTRAACPTMAFESTYMGMLGGESTVGLSGTHADVVLGPWRVAVRALRRHAPSSSFPLRPGAAPRLSDTRTRTGLPRLSTASSNGSTAVESESVIPPSQLPRNRSPTR